MRMRTTTAIIAASALTIGLTLAAAAAPASAGDACIFDGDGQPGHQDRGVPPWNPPICLEDPTN